MNFTEKRVLKHMWQQQISLYESAKLGCYQLKYWFACHGINQSGISTGCLINTGFNI